MDARRTPSALIPRMTSRWRRAVAATLGGALALAPAGCRRHKSDEELLRERLATPQVYVAARFAITTVVAEARRNPALDRLNR